MTLPDVSGRGGDAGLATKHDGYKPRPDLIAPEMIDAMGRVLEFGARKYEPWEWAKGKEWSRDYAAVLRHLNAWHGGEDLDPESGASHLAHAACDLMFLIACEARGVGTDDRPRYGRPSTPAAARFRIPQPEPTQRRD